MHADGCHGEAAQQAQQAQQRPYLVQALREAGPRLRVVGAALKRGAAQVAAQRARQVQRLQDVVLLLVRGAGLRAVALAAEKFGA